MSGVEAAAETVAGQVVAWLERMGCRRVFLVPAAQIEPLIAALSSSTIHMVCAQHELGAAFMADAETRIGAPLGVCLVGGGPGLAYAVAAAVTARVDQRPVLFISGAPAKADVPTFQDVGSAGGRDLAVMAAALDYSQLIDSPDRVGAALERAKTLLQADSPSPLHLCFPVDVQRDRSSPSHPRAAPRAVFQRFPPGRLGALLKQTRIAILAGRGCVTEEVSELLAQVLKRHQLVLLTTLDAKGLVDETDPLCLGPVGYAGTLRARAAISQLDGLLVLGADHQAHDLGGPLIGVAPEHTYVQTYGVPTADASLELAASCRDVLKTMLAEPAPSPQLEVRRKGWIGALNARPNHLAVQPHSDAGAMDLPDIVRTLRDVVPRSAPMFCDAGIFRRFFGHYWTAYGPKTMFVASQTAPMGWAIAGCVGAAISDMSRPAFALTGDGCMRMLGTEIATAVQAGAAAKIVISDNGLLGNVYLRAQNARVAALCRSPDIDWVAFARALGASGYSTESEAEFRGALTTATAEPGPSVIRVASVIRPFEKQDVP